jgi:FtsP/CotA-like multicopper oxidase with cupredoxin domain
MITISRWTSMVLAAALVTACSTVQSAKPPAVAPPSPASPAFQGAGPTVPPQRSEALRELEIRRSSHGELNTQLTVGYTDTTIGNDQVHLRLYNGKLVGPALRVRPGDTLRIAFKNDLPPSADGATHVHSNTPGHFNATNLHTHGLHVSPKDPADNVLLIVNPGDAVHNYEYKIPKNHPAGTFWYHAHVHGATSIQVSSGMAGALIVEGGLDDVPEIHAAADKTMLFQQIQYHCSDPGQPVSYDCAGKVGQVEDFAIFGTGTWANSGRFTTINGVVQPQIAMKTGEVQRWRFIHGGVRETLSVAVARADDPQFVSQPGWLNVIAKDGLATGRIDPAVDVELEPGYRSDVLVKAPAVTGTYYLIDEKTAATDSLLAEEEPRKVLAVINVSEGQVAMSLPTSAELAPYRPYKDVEDAELTGRQAVVFKVTNTEHTVDGKEYDPNDPPRQLKLGGVEEWTVSSAAGNHPYHIHVNAFQVMEKGADGKLHPGDWKDTMLVKPSPADPIVVRSRYEDFDGPFVLHCHILDHEDQGMMQGVEIVR